MLIAIPLAVMIAFSRLYLYVHFPSDILGAAVLGVGISLLVIHGSRKARQGLYSALRCGK